MIQKYQQTNTTFLDIEVYVF